MQTDTHPRGTMVLEGKSKLINRPRMSKGKRYDAVFIYIPSELFRDSQFPFRSDDDVVIRVDAKNKRLVIEKASAQGKDEGKK